MTVVVSATEAHSAKIATAPSPRHRGTNLRQHSHSLLIMLQPAALSFSYLEYIGLAVLADDGAYIPHRSHPFSRGTREKQDE